MLLTPCVRTYRDCYIHSKIGFCTLLISWKSILHLQIFWLKDSCNLYYNHVLYCYFLATVVVWKSGLLILPLVVECLESFLLLTKGCWFDLKSWINDMLDDHIFGFSLPFYLSLLSVIYQSMYLLTCLNKCLVDELNSNSIHFLVYFSNKYDDTLNMDWRNLNNACL